MARSATTGALYAVKRMPPELRDQARREIRIQSRVSGHPNIVPILLYVWALRLGPYVAKAEPNNILCPPCCMLHAYTVVSVVCGTLPLLRPITVVAPA